MQKIGFHELTICIVTNAVYFFGLCYLSFIVRKLLHIYNTFGIEWFFQTDENTLITGLIEFFLSKNYFSVWFARQSGLSTHADTGNFDVFMVVAVTTTVAAAAADDVQNGADK